MVWDQDVAGSNPVVPTILLGVQQFPIRAALPYYPAETVDGQRGGGVLEKSIRALRKLNTVGYGTTLPLNLWDLTLASIAQHRILTGQHCLPRTSGAGRSCAAR